MISADTIVLLSRR